MLPAGLAAMLSMGSPWLIWGVSLTVSLALGLWLSTWAQAAAIRAAFIDEGAVDSLRESWSQTWGFGVVLTWLCLVVGGGLLLLIVPGIILGVLLFFAPFYQLSGEGEGLDAVGLSCARVKPVLGPIVVRLGLIGFIVAVPSWIPWVGWIIGPLWAPFGLVACARLAADLKCMMPRPEKPRGLAMSAVALSAVLMLVLGAGSWFTARKAQRLYADYNSGALSLRVPDPATSASFLALLEGKGSNDDIQRVVNYALSMSSSTSR